jgi:hypothetical protein
LDREKDRLKTVLRTGGKKADVSHCKTMGYKKFRNQEKTAAQPFSIGWAAAYG